MKKKIYSDNDYTLSMFMKALSNPARIAVIRKLVNKNEDFKCSCGEDCDKINCTCGCKCGELVEILPMSQSTVSQHIKELRSAGLIDMNGRKGEYTLNHSTISKGMMLLIDLLGKSKIMEMENKNCNCGPDCQCGDNCQCGDDCQCGNNCQCGDDCQCGDNCQCN